MYRAQKPSACPPEDCGGVWGYEHLREVLADPADEEHEEMLQWLGAAAWRKGYKP
jgi:Plasmid pRiA4b ORF-3-like protein